MANRALGAPRLTGPQPVPEQAVAAGSAKHAAALDPRRGQPAGGRRVFLRHAGLRAVPCWPGRIDRLRIDYQVQPFLARFRLEILFPQRLGSGQRSVRRPAFCLRHDRFFHSGAAHRGAAGGRRRGLSSPKCAPRWLRGALAFTTELLAAIPSVIYGLWAIFVLVPLLRQYVQPWLAKYLGWTGLV